MIKIRYWILAIFSAMSIHVFAFGMYTIKYPETFQPVPPLQEAGIEIDISMLEATTIEKQQATAAAQPMTDNAEETAAAVAQKPHIDPEPSPAKRTESKKPLQQTEIKKRSIRLLSPGSLTRLLTHQKCWQQRPNRHRRIPPLPKISWKIPRLPIRDPPLKAVRFPAR